MNYVCIVILLQFTIPCTSAVSNSNVNININSALSSHGDWCPLTIWSPVAARDDDFDEC
jgi:hypothetical protein